eukprot:scaffold2612_cov132-Skeletonema_menzelii.AAC.4
MRPYFISIIYTFKRAKLRTDRPPFITPIASSKPTATTTPAQQSRTVKLDSSTKKYHHTSTTY